jgi:hypothetical protein
MFGDLALGRAGAEAGGSMDLANLSQRHADSREKNAAMRTFGHLFGQSPYATGGSHLADMGQAPSGLQSVLGGLQTGLGAYMGQGQDAQNKKLLQQLFAQQGQSSGFQNPNAGRNMNLQTFTGG